MRAFTRTWPGIPTVWQAVLVALMPVVAFAQLTGWTRIDSPVRSPLHQVCFVNAAEGFALAGHTGQMINTRDGGETWYLVGRADSVGFGAMLFRTNYLGWIAGPRGKLFRTETGGLSWQKVPTPSRTYHYYDLLSYKNEFLIAAGTTRSFSRRKPVLEIYVDSLEAWNEVDETLPGFSVHDLAEDSSGNLWAGGRDLLLMIPQDGSAPQVMWRGTRGKCGTIEHVCFKTAREGWAVGSCGLMLHTLDGGRSWTEREPVSTNRLLEMGFSHPDVGYLAAERTGEGPTLFRSLDGGKSWDPLIGAGETSYYDMEITPIRIILVSGAGHIYLREREEDYRMQGDEPPSDMVREIEGELRPGMLMQERPPGIEPEETQQRRPLGR
ncbi:hypothetical protein GF324_11210 [bacterium]|nr:hypothetical protein [bacterium]